MDLEPAAGEPTERKVARRGLIAAIGALGAGAVMHLKGAGKAEAAPSFELNVTSNTATAETRLAAASMLDLPLLQVTNGGSTSATRSAITAVLSGTSGTGGHALRAVCNDVSGIGAFGAANDATGIGVRGESINGTGVVGLTSASNSAASGVNGQAQSGAATGVRGSNIGSAGAGIKGVSNASSHTANGDGNGTGVHGKSGTGTGVIGQSDSSTGVVGSSNTGAGVVGTSADGAGVIGVSLGGNGVEAHSSGTSDFGLRAVNTSNGTGIKGLSNTAGSSVADGNGSGTGVHGKSNGGFGVLGESAFVGVKGEATGSGVGLVGKAVNNFAIYGASTNYVGLWGESQTQVGLTALTNGANQPALYILNTNPTGPTKFGALIDGNVVISGNLQVVGANKNALVPHPDGMLRTLYCLESPEAWFEDFGRAPLWAG